ncbi:hypothetical protein T484DRAFT_1897964 [Baffinella frigidus]|nr:hypothetical protein T484DRAFT_1897964 [Cryptophyta sp. CCMP2293]
MCETLASHVTVVGSEGSASYGAGLERAAPGDASVVPFDRPRIILSALMEPGESRPILHALVLLEHPAEEDGEATAAAESSPQHVAGGGGQQHAVDPGHDAVITSAAGGAEQAGTEAQDGETAPGLERIVEGMCGLWVGEYGAHGLEVVHFSRTASRLTQEDPAQTAPLGHGTDSINVVDLVGLKVTGDPNVPSGQITCVVSTRPISEPYVCRCRFPCACPEDSSGLRAVFPARLQTAQHGFVNPRYNEAHVASLEEGSLLLIWKNEGSLLLIWKNVHSRRLYPAAFLPSPSTAPPNPSHPEASVVDVPGALPADAELTRQVRGFLVKMAAQRPSAETRREEEIGSPGFSR